MIRITSLRYMRNCVLCVSGSLDKKVEKSSGIGR